MNAKFERKEFVGVLIKLVYRTIQENMNDEALEILAGIRTLRPKLKELDVTAGWIAFRRGQYLECIQLLRGLEDHPSEWDMAKGMIANCQYVLGDRGWEMTLNELEQRKAGPIALQMVDNLIAVRNKAAGGFAESANDAQEPTETASLSAIQMPYMFMRA